MNYKKNNRSKNRWVFHHAVDEFISNPNFLYFVSFPRTGSHWFRMFMEEYTNMPSLVQSFTIENPKSFWSYHRHDKNLDEVNGRKNVLYLYRNPVDTIYSQISYEKENIEDSLDKYINMYSSHLIKWLYNNSSCNFINMTYEKLKDNPVEEISKVLLFLQQIYPNKKAYNISERNIIECYNKIKKQTVKKATGNTNNGVINLSNNYESNREIFHDKYSEYILRRFVEINKGLELWTH